jgi:3-mercaptopyruvate sulfurtransferase SseA
MMRKVFILPAILILMVLIFINPSWSEEAPVWWPTALAEAQQDGYVLTTPQELRQLYDSGGNFTVVDVRPDYEFNTGHLPEAKNFEIDLGDRLELKPQKAEAFKNVIGTDKDRMIVIYCRSFR